VRKRGSEMNRSYEMRCRRKAARCDEGGSVPVCKAFAHYEFFIASHFMHFSCRVPSDAIHIWEQCIMENVADLAKMR
jgi:hypothetical protein